LETSYSSSSQWEVGYYTNTDPKNGLLPLRLCVQGHSHKERVPLFVLVCQWTGVQCQRSASRADIIKDALAAVSPLWANNYTSDLARQTWHKMVSRTSWFLSLGCPRQTFLQHPGRRSAYFFNSPYQQAITRRYTYRCDHHEKVEPTQVHGFRALASSLAARIREMAVNPCCPISLDDVHLSR
jgi:hypothetical protein